MTQEEHKEYLAKFQKGQILTLVYNKKRIAGIYKGYVEDGDDIHITLQHKENGIGWSYPCKGLKQIEYIK